MSDAQVMVRAAATFLEIVHNLKPDQLGQPTPCADFDVRKLVNHLLFWGPSLEAAGRKESLPPPATAEADLDLTEGDWADVRDALDAHVRRTVATWSEPGAWDGVTRMGGPMELPAPLVAGMIVGEFVVHGWDLARATGQQPTWDDELLDYVRDEVAYSAELGRQMGIYGPEVAVPEAAPCLDHVLGLTGRDPAWTP